MLGVLMISTLQNLIMVMPKQLLRGGYYHDTHPWPHANQSKRRFQNLYEPVSFSMALL